MLHSLVPLVTPEHLCIFLGDLASTTPTPCDSLFVRHVLAAHRHETDLTLRLLEGFPTDLALHADALLYVRTVHAHPDRYTAVVGSLSTTQGSTTQGSTTSSLSSSLADLVTVSGAILGEPS